MSKKFSLSNLNDDDVVSFGTFCYKVSKIRQALNHVISFSDVGSHLHSRLASESVIIYSTNSSDKKIKCLFDPGIDGEVLRLESQKWKKCKVRITFEIEIEDEEEESDENSTLIEPSEINQLPSPLDDLREQLKNIEDSE